MRMYAFVYHRINDDIHAAADHRAELVSVLARRAVAAALEEAPE